MLGFFFVEEEFLTRNKENEVQFFFKTKEHETWNF